MKSQFHPPSLKAVFFWYQISSCYNSKTVLLYVPEYSTVPTNNMYAPNSTMGWAGVGVNWWGTGGEEEGGGLRLVRFPA